jgi:ketosteroid isomerase-like protein
MRAVHASDELRATVVALYGAMSSGDPGAVEAFYSLDALGVFVGTDEAEFWTDSARHNADVRRYFDGSSGALRWEAGDAIARVDGDLGWTVDRPTLILPDGSTIRPRVTLVWRREDHGWRVVHSHASIGQAG